jgi:hypothetical protein
VWTITEPVSGLTVPLRVESGDIQVVEDYKTAVHFGLRNPSPWVTEGVRRAASISVPDVVCRSMPELNLLRQLRDLGRRCVLTDDLGTAWPVRFSGPFSYTVADSVDRDTAPVIRAKLSLIGVA